jgi:hypothetical protein
VKVAFQRRIQEMNGQFAGGQQNAPTDSCCSEETGSVQKCSDNTTVNAARLIEIRIVGQIDVNMSIIVKRKRRPKVLLDSS